MIPSENWLGTWKALTRACSGVVSRNAATLGVACLVAFFFVVACCSSRLAAQTPPSSGLEAMRIFVEEKDVDRVVTPAFLTVRMDELDKLLKEYVQRQSLSVVRDTGIQRATYVARWSEQTLVSRASQFQVATSGTTPLTIGRVSLAIEEPVGAPELSVPLTRQLRYLDDNRLQILADEKQSEYWFGFKAKPRRRDSGQYSIDVQVPQATVSMMLVAVPTHTVITSNLPCAEVIDVNKYLPEGWPATALPSLTADEHWFAIWLSGQQNCSLNFVPATKVTDSAYRMLVASAQGDTQITPAGIQVSSQFRLASAPPGGKLRLLIDDQLHVRSISVGSEAVAWQAIHDEAAAEGETATRGKSRVIEVPCQSTDSGLVIVTVDCIGRIPLPFEGVLPRVEVEGAYVLDGRCTLLGHDRIQVEDARSTAHVLATTGQSGVAQWQWQWTGKAPTTSVRLRVSPHPWTVRALTRLDVQADVVVASVHANISTSHIQGNQTTLKLASGWFVDSVELENAPTGVSASIIDAAGDTSELSIRWDERRTDLDVRVVLKAHYHQSTEVESLKLNSTRILTLPGADQIDTYVVESSGRFRLELDSELLRMRVREDDLVPWQKDLLPRLADPWIFSAGRAVLPSLRLSRTRATLEAKLYTTINDDHLQVTAHYGIVCKPISGSIKQVKLQMSLPANAVAPIWTFVDPFSINSRAKLSAISSAISSSTGETTFTIDLSEDVAEQFQLQTELVLARREGQNAQASPLLSVPLPRMRQAVSQEAVLVVPMHYKLPSLPSVEILPPGLCCDGGKLVESTVAPDVVAMRYDASAFTKVDLQPQADARKGGWAQSQLHEHWQYRAGRTLHRSTWDLAIPAEQKLELIIPVHWEFQSLTVNDEERTGATVTVSPSKDSSGNARLDQQSLTTVVPKGNRVRIQLSCSSANSTRWFQPVVYDAPVLPLSILKSRTVVWLPESRWATAGWPMLSDSWEERFCPRRWWHLLSFQPGPIVERPQRAANYELAEDIQPEIERANSQIVAKNNWWKLEFIDPAAAPALWLVDQSLAGAGCLCVFLVLCIAISMGCGMHWRRWWLAWTIVGAALAVVPVVCLLPVQMFALALIAATLTRLGRTTAQRSRAVSSRRNETMQLSRSTLPRTRVLSVWLIGVVAWNTSIASAQPFKTGIKDKREVFGILIPVDDKYRVAGEFVYISPRLYSVLRNSGQSESLTSEVRIASAIYSLSISNDLVNLTNTVGDVTVELSVQATTTDAELRLPFLRSEATLVRASLDSQSLIQGDRIRQDAESLMWRSTDSERHILRLTLKPRNLVQRDGRGQLSLSIPAIPTARLELQSENVSDLRDISVDSVGGVQLETFRTLSARLGPLNRLNVSWPLAQSRSGPTQVQSDTWVHSRGDKVMAMCQLRMRGASSLMGTMSIAGDSNWIPVGQDWDDFRMVGTEGASPVGRPIYNVEKLDDRSGDELTLKILMLPKDENATTLSIPFLSMQQPLVPVARTLAVSRTDIPQWKTVGTDWQPLLASQATQLWDGPRLAEQPTLWKVPSGTVQATLQRVALPTAPVVDESTDVQLQMPETKIEYVARWSTPLIGPPLIRFQIPNGLRIDSALVDAIKARYSVHRIAGSNTMSELVVFIDSSLGGIQSLNLQFSVATRLNRVFRLPRPLLMESEIRSSVVQIYRGVELISSHAVVDDSTLEMETLDASDSALPQELQTPVGRLELGDRLRESPELPLEFNLTRAPAARVGRAIIRFTRSDQGWRGQLDAMVEVKAGGVNHLFFDVPRSLESSLKDPLEANAAITLWPSPDSNRMLLSVLPVRDAADQAHISFAFRLPSSGVSQTINIPDIRLLGVTSPRPALALPMNLAGEAVRWTGIGRPLAANWMQSMKIKGLDLSPYELFEPIDNQSQAIWHLREQREKDIEILMTCMELSGDHRRSTSQSKGHPRSIDSMQGEICYWLEPHDHPYLDIDLPSSCQLVGLESHDRPTNWLQVTDRQIRVLIQPSYLPSRLRLFVRWPQLDPTNATLELPSPHALLQGPVLVRQRPAETTNVRSSQRILPISEAHAVSPEVVASTQAQVWASSLTNTAPAAAGRGQDEISAWLPAWDPIWLGLDNASMVTTRRQTVTNRNSSSPDQVGEEVQLSVADFWKEYLAQHGMENYQSASGGPDSLQAAGWSIENMTPISQFEWQQVQTTTSATTSGSEASSGTSSVSDARLQHFTLTLGATQHTSELVWRWSFASGWVAIALAIAGALSGSLRGLALAVGELIWPLWFALALASAALLPVFWPTIVVLAGLAIVLVRRYRELRRDRQFVLMPKRM